MIDTKHLALVIFIGISFVLVALPFVPAYWEWKHPSDSGALPISTGGEDDIEKSTEWVDADGAVRLAANSVAFSRISSGTVIVVNEGARFERLNAPSIEFGSKNSHHTTSGEPEKLTASLSDIPNVRKQTPSLYFIQGDCELAAETTYHGSLIVTGRLTIGARTTVIGDIKARKDLRMMDGARVQGAVTCNKNIELFSNASLLGPLLSERDIVLGLNTVIGLLEAPTTVSGKNILVAEGVIVHGSIWAHDIGMMRST
jgi:cytoskeletal protein CcmA (bactofilin family)